MVTLVDKNVGIGGGKRFECRGRQSGKARKAGDVEATSQALGGSCVEANVAWGKAEEVLKSFAPLSKEGGAGD